MYGVDFISDIVLYWIYSIVLVRFVAKFDVAIAMAKYFQVFFYLILNVRESYTVLFLLSHETILSYNKECEV